MPNGRDLNWKLNLVRKLLLIIYLPICLTMLLCAVYSTYLTVKTWNCRISDESERNNSTNTPMRCYTVLDSLSSHLSKYIPERKVLMIVRTVSLTNTLLTYISAWIATYKISLLPLLWLTTVSIASFFITLNISIIFGPLTGKICLTLWLTSYYEENIKNKLYIKWIIILLIGVNNLELVPLFIGIKGQPFIITGIVLAIDLLIAIMALSLVINSYKKRL